MSLSGTKSKTWSTLSSPLGDRLDIGVNSAGIALRGPIEDISEADWDRVLDLDLKAVFFCCQAEGRAMLQRGIWLDH